ncbi:sensor histidine kinase [Bifidobacterium miconisargentati]|uniref:sensor histidine kinase n=1 Tax=Bifidobacterium miconisargentati TaxID=2834437 RepID=UPI001BDC2016|nr:HAMP domain-containing sensor histidine kinase [Bifidobacterium miconisargentati]MBW3089495.1 HAMP domain-containing histidine kinase [Bifidobacterium miconisargentati]
MWIAGVLAGLIAGIVIGSAVYGREMRRMARFLCERPAESNARLGVELPDAASRELARAINSQLDAIQTERIAALTKVQEFQRDLSSLAHDVRTPLMGAQGHIQLALLEPDAPYDSVSPDSGGEDATGTAETTMPDSGAVGRERHLRVALQRLDDMRGLLDQLFAYARANDPDQTLDIEPIMIQPLIAEVLVGHYPEFEERGWEPSLDFDNNRFMLEADRTALRRIIDNLITNALRHGTGAPAITQRDDAITFSNPIAAQAATDIDPDKLFDRFYQADDARGKRGSGLGLAVAQSLAYAMHLRLSAAVETEEHNGADARLSITIAPEPRSDSRIE